MFKGKSLTLKGKRLTLKGKRLDLLLRFFDYVKLMLVGRSQYWSNKKQFRLTSGELLFSTVR
ncbi:hypothetical protein DTT04_04660 [Salmonella enterica]|nr:hypothetical protein [Salmonella enterica]